MGPNSREKTTPVACVSSLRPPGRFRRRAEGKSPHCSFLHFAGSTPFVSTSAQFDTKPSMGPSRSCWRVHPLNRWKGRRRAEYWRMLGFPNLVRTRAARATSGDCGWRRSAGAGHWSAIRLRCSMTCHPRTSGFQRLFTSFRSAQLRRAPSCSRPPRLRMVPSLDAGGRQSLQWIAVDPRKRQGSIG
jgi:hypothetical protein